MLVQRREPGFQKVQGGRGKRVALRQARDFCENALRQIHRRKRTGMGKQHFRPSKQQVARVFQGEMEPG